MIQLKEYQHYSTTELLEDKAFLGWLRSGKPPSALQKDFLQAAPELAEKIQEARQLLLAIEHFQEVPNQAPIKIGGLPFEAKLLQTMQEAKGSKNRSLGSRSIWSIAATVLLLITLGIAFWPSSTATQTVVYETGFGEWKQIELPDGSTVELNAHSKLIWKGQQQRVVYLEGEAFFTVAKKPRTQANFTVITNDLEVEVLGTRFNVQAASEGTEVFLEEGAVTIYAQEQKVQLQPDQLFSYQKGKSMPAAPKVSEAVHHSSWKDGILNMQEQTVAKCFEKIEKIYGIQIICTNEILLQTIKTIAVPIDDLPTTQRILEQVFEVGMEKSNDSLIVK